MRIKIASGSAAAGFGIVGTGLAMALPEEKWIGFLIIATGLTIFVFDIRFERGQIEAGEHRLGLIFHRKQPQKMVALIGMILSGIAFAGFCSWYFWPHSERVPPTTAGARPPAPNPWKHELEDLYASDFSDLLSGEKTFDSTFRDTTLDKEFVVKSRVRLYFDFRTNTDFISIFIPMVRDEVIIELIKILRDKIPEFRESERGIIVGTSGGGDPYVDSKDMKFSGRVFVYTMQPLTVIQLGELTSWYQDAGMGLQIRGTAYWQANKDR